MKNVPKVVIPLMIHNRCSHGNEVIAFDEGYFTNLKEKDQCGCL